MNQEQIDRIEEKIDALMIVLNGKPGEPDKGLVVKVDRLEQQRNNFTWSFGIMLTGLMGLIIEKVVGIFK